VISAVSNWHDHRGSVGQTAVAVLRAPLSLECAILFEATCASGVGHTWDKAMLDALVPLLNDDCFVRAVRVSQPL